jgi:adenosine deaminase
MHDFVPGEEPADEHFFATFDKYMALKQTNGEWGHEVASRAAAQHEQYIELMLTVPCDDCKHLSEQIENKKLDELLSVKSLLTTWDFSADIAKAQQLLRDTEAKRKSLGESDIKVRYLFKAFRGLPHKTVFAQLAFAFQLLAAESKQPEPLMVGLNLVMREDGYHALKNYSDQMKVIGFLKNQYPGVRVSLHAGELTLGLVPPEDLTFHINEAVHVAKAERIGHGTDIIYEKDNEALLKYMASNHIVVEIIPSSADVILGVRGNKHPLALYLKHHVPMVISTDDEGVLRSDLTNEFQMAVEQHNLTYADLKKMVRNSLEYSFLPGDSLWIDHDYHRLHPACQQDKPASKTLSTSCQQFIKSSEKAERQWVLEREVIDFEAWARIPAPTYH